MRPRRAYKTLLIVFDSELDRLLMSNENTDLFVLVPVLIEALKRGLTFEGRMWNDIIMLTEPKADVF